MACSVDRPLVRPRRTPRIRHRARTAWHPRSVGRDRHRLRWCERCRTHQLRPSARRVPRATRRQLRPHRRSLSTPLADHAGEAQGHHRPAPRSDRRRGRRTPVAHQPNPRGALTTGTSTDTTEVYVGQWDKLRIGLRTQMSISLLRERYMDNGQFEFFAYLRGDIQLARPTAFNVTTDQPLAATADGPPYPGCKTGRPSAATLLRRRGHAVFRDFTHRKRCPPRRLSLRCRRGCPPGGPEGEMTARVSATPLVPKQTRRSTAILFRDRRSPETLAVVSMYQSVGNANFRRKRDRPHLYARSHGGMGRQDRVPARDRTEVTQ